MEINKTGNRIIILADEVMDIQNSAEIRDALLQAINENNVIEVSNQKILEHDLTYLQLLVSASLYAEACKKEFYITGCSSSLIEELKAFNLSKSITNSAEVK
ncbi:MAG: hypothetical protein Q8903_03695 [Bacteroidota bacterium]|nr:hypothetical protein [Bacteroidota bacterium]